MPTPLTDADKVLRNDTGKDIVEKLDDIAQALGVGVNADQINYDNTESGLEADDVQNVIDELNANKAEKNDLVIAKSIDISAPIQTFSDGGDNIPLKSCEVAIVAQQASGTPSPDNPLSISGFSAIDVNVQDKNWVTYSNQKLINSVTPTITNGNVKVACSGSSAQFHQIVYTLPNSEKLAGKTITVSYDTVVTSSARVNDWRLIFLSYVNGGSETVLVSLKSTDANHATLNIGNSVTEIVVLFRLSQSVSDTTGDYVTWNKVQLEIGDENTTFEEYTDTTHTVSLGQTIYGGTAELVNGNGSKTFDISDLGNLSWSYDSTNKRFVALLTGAKLNGSSRAYTNPNSKCTNYEVIFTDREYTYNEMTSDISSKNNVIWLYTASGQTYVNVKDTAYTDTPTFKTAMTGVKFVYELETSTAFTFTGANISTLSGTNNIYADCGDVNELEYFNQNGNDMADIAKSIHNNNGLNYSSGSIVMIDDGAYDVPLKSCNVEITAKQAGSGTPSPSNVRTISGVDNVDITVVGKNWMPQTYVSGTQQFDLILSESIPAGTYTFSAIAKSSDIDKTVCNVYIRASDNTVLADVNISRGTKQSFTFAASKPISKINLYASDNASHSSGDTFSFSEIQIEKGTIASEFENYSKSTYSMNLSETCYGGYGDVTKANDVTKTMGCFDLGELNWGKLSNVTGAFYSIQSTAYAPRYNNDFVANAICEQYKVVSRNNLPNNDCSFSISYSDQIYLTVKDERYSTSEAFKAAVSGIKLVYELATPTILNTGYVLPKTLSGINNIYANTGDINLEYFDSSIDSVAKLIRYDEPVITGTKIPYGSLNLSNLVVRQYGKVVTVNGFIDSVSLVANTAVNICNIRGISWPPDNIRIIGAYADHAYEVPQGNIYLIFGSQGGMQVKSPVTATKSIYFSFSYIA